MTDAEGTIFNRAVHFVLPHAIPTHLDRSGEFRLGDVLVYEKKKRPLMPWRKHRLVYTGVNIANLLTETINVEKGVEQIFAEAKTTRTFGESAKVDAEVQYAIAHLGVNIAETEHATVSADFGKVERHFTNLSSLLTRRQFQVARNDPIVREAMTHNRTIFVINHLYVAAKADVFMSFTGDTKDADAGNQVPAPAPASNTPPTTTTSGTGTTTATTTTTTPTSTTATTTTTTPASTTAMTTTTPASTTATTTTTTPASTTATTTTTTTPTSTTGTQPPPPPPPDATPMPPPTTTTTTPSSTNGTQPPFPPDATPTPPPTTTNTVPVAYTIGGDVDLSFQKTGLSVVNRNIQTNIAYRVMRFKLGSHGNLVPQLRAGIRHVKVKLADEVDFEDPSSLINAKNQAEDKCEYTHDQLDVMAAREDET